MHHSIFNMQPCRQGRRALPIMAALALLLAALTARADWPDFRGPAADGHVAATGLPLTWSETANVTWKTPLPERGWSSPVVLGGQIWLTSATPDGHDFFALCVDAKTGKILVNKKLFHAESPEPLGNPMNCYAAPSPVVEPGRVYFSFGSYGTACLDTATAEVRWQRQNLPCRHYRGPGSSPFLYQNLLILTMDGVDQQYTVALDKNNGQTVWKTERSTHWTDVDSQGRPIREGDMRKSFCTPIAITVEGKPQLISGGSMEVFGYDPASGKELWKVRHASYTAAARPVFGEGLIFVPTGYGTAEIWGVRPGGQGDLTASNVAWKAKKADKTSSPILVDGLLYLASDEGLITCLEAKTGAVVWSERVNGKFAASPILADGRLYFFSQEGKTFVLQPGRAYQLLATNTLAAGFMASPAVEGKALILRTKTDLYRVEAGK